MYKSGEELEEKGFYRLVKVIFIISCIALFLFSIFITSFYIPTKTSTPVSYTEFVCTKNNKSYDSSHFGINPEDYWGLSETEEREIAIVCGYKPPKPSEIEDLFERLKLPESYSDWFTANPYHEPISIKDYGTPILIFSGINAIGFGILSLIKKSLVYIAFGKKQK